MNDEERLEIWQHFLSDTIKHELERNKPLVDRILSDITYQSADNLVSISGISAHYLLFCISGIISYQQNCWALSAPLCASLDEIAPHISKLFMFVFCSFVINIDHCALSIIVIVGFSLKFSHIRKLIENYSLFFACFTLGISRFIAHFLYVCCTWSLQVDGLTKAQEEGYTYKHYFGSAHHQAYADDYQWVDDIFVQNYFFNYFIYLCQCVKNIAHFAYICAYVWGGY